MLVYTTFKLATDSDLASAIFFLKPWLLGKCQVGIAAKFIKVISLFSAHEEDDSSEDTDTSEDDDEEEDEKLESHTESGTLHNEEEESEWKSSQKKPISTVESFTTRILKPFQHLDLIYELRAIWGYQMLYKLT